MLRSRLRLVRRLAVAAPVLLAGCGGESTPEITYNAGPATLPAAPSPSPDSSFPSAELAPLPRLSPLPVEEAEAPPAAPVLADQIDRGIDRTGAAMDATLERVDDTVSRTAERADQVLRKADATVDRAVERVDATVSQAEQRADQAVSQAVDRAREATGRAAERVRRVGDALDQFTRSLERTPRAPR